MNMNNGANAPPLAMANQQLRWNAFNTPPLNSLFSSMSLNSTYSNPNGRSGRLRFRSIIVSTVTLRHFIYAEASLKLAALSGWPLMYKGKLTFPLNISIISKYPSRVSLSLDTFELLNTSLSISLTFRSSISISLCFLDLITCYVSYLSSNLFVFCLR